VSNNIHLVKFASADVEVVRKLHDCLIEAFEKFAQQQAKEKEEGLAYIDALMGCHNFYKRIILDLEARSDDKNNMFKATAISTLIEGLRMGGHFTRV